MSSDQMLTKSSDNNNTATISATSTLPNAEPLPNLNKTIPGWYSQQTRGWPWLSWSRRTTQIKALTLLQDTHTYKVLSKDATSQLKNKLIFLLKDIKQTGGLNTNKYKQLYPTSAAPLHFIAFPKFTK